MMNNPVFKRSKVLAVYLVVTYPWTLPGLYRRVRILDCVTRQIRSLGNGIDLAGFGRYALL